MKLSQYHAKAQLLLQKLGYKTQLFPTQVKVNGTTAPLDFLAKSKHQTLYIKMAVDLTQVITGVGALYTLAEQEAGKGECLIFFQAPRLLKDDHYNVPYRVEDVRFLRGPSYRLHRMEETMCGGGRKGTFSFPSPEMFIRPCKCPYCGVIAFREAAGYVSYFGSGLWDMIACPCEVQRPKITASFRKSGWVFSPENSALFAPEIEEALKESAEFKLEKAASML